MIELDGCEYLEGDVYRCLLAICERRGFKRGWASNQYRELAGQWPRFAREIGPGIVLSPVEGWVKARARAAVEEKIAAKRAQWATIRAKLYAGFGREVDV